MGNVEARRTWKLRHLSAAVVAAAAALEVGVRTSPGLVLALLAIVGPPLAAAVVCESRMKRTREMSLLPWPMGEKLVARAAWFMIFLIPYLLVLASLAGD